MSLSEQTRQFYESVLSEGFVSPEHTWDELSILSFFHVTHSRGYDWISELKQAGLIVKIPGSTFSQPDRYYAVPPPGFRPTEKPSRLTVSNAVGRGSERGFKLEGFDDSSVGVAVESLRTLSKSLRENEAKRAETTPINWSKWGAIAAIVAIPVGLISWWFS